MHSLRSHFKTLKVGNKRQQFWGKLGQLTKKTAIMTVEESRNQNMFFFRQDLISCFVGDQHLFLTQWTFNHGKSGKCYIILWLLFSFYIITYSYYSWSNIYFQANKEKEKEKPDINGINIPKVQIQFQPLTSLQSLQYSVLYLTKKKV